jgi:hypothetical protein
VLLSLAATGVTGAVVLGAFLARRWRVHVRIKARVDAAGSWSVASGGALWPFAVTAGLSPGGTAWTAHALGRTVARGTRLPLVSGASTRRPRRSRAAAAEAGRRALALARTLLYRLRFDRFDVRVRGAADDPATTARVLGLLAAAGGVVAPRANLATEVDWFADAPFVHVDCDVQASFVPWRVGCDLARASLSRLLPPQGPNQ